MVSALASDAKGPRFDPRPRGGKFRSPNMLSLVSFAGMTLDKCIVLRIGTLTGCPLCRESHPLCRLKNPTVISIWLLVGFHPATWSVQCTSADNAGKRAPGSIYKKKIDIAIPNTYPGISELHSNHLKFNWLTAVNHTSTLN